MGDSFVTELRALRAEIEGLRDDLQHALRRLLSVEDRRDLKLLLPLIHDLMGGNAWSAVSLKEAADQADAAELSAALDEWVSDSGGLRALGGFLARCSDIGCDGRRLVEAGNDRDGALYFVRVSAASKLASSAAGSSFSGTLVIPELSTQGGHRDE